MPRLMTTQPGLALLAIGLLAATGSCSLVSGLTGGERKLIPGSCSVAYPSEAYPSDKIHPSVTQEITAPDGRTPMCLIGLPQKPVRWKWSLDGTKLAYEIATNPPDPRSQLHIANADGTEQNSVEIVVGGAYNSTWILSPDGQYVRSEYCSPGTCRVDVIAIPTGKTLCMDAHSVGPSVVFSSCPPLKLSDGRWWSAVNPDIVSSTNSAEFWKLIAGSVAYLSPDGKWVIGSTADWYIASIDGRIMNKYSMPMPDGVRANPNYCYGNPNQFAWSPDSKHFGVIPAGSQQIFVWTRQENGSVNLADTITLSKCDCCLHWLTSDNKFMVR